MLVDVTRQKYPFSLPDLPYAYDALEPHIDTKTLQLHHREHHATYVKKLNEAVAKETALHDRTLIDLLADSAKLPEGARTAIVNNGGGHLLHDVFWNSLTNKTAQEPQGALADALVASFGSFAEFRKKFTEASTRHFASGWVALTVDHASRELKIEDLKDHAVPKPAEKSIVLILDIWEHAYYLKYQNRRPEFIEAFWNIIDWPNAQDRFERAKPPR